MVECFRIGHFLGLEGIILVSLFLTDNLCERLAKGYILKVPKITRDVYKTFTLPSLDILYRVQKPIILAVFM